MGNRPDSVRSRGVADLRTKGGGATNCPKPGDWVTAVFGKLNGSQQGSVAHDLRWGFSWGISETASQTRNAPILMERQVKSHQGCRHKYFHRGKSTYQYSPPRGSHARHRLSLLSTPKWLTYFIPISVTRQLTQTARRSEFKAKFPIQARQNNVCLSALFGMEKTLSAVKYL